MNVNFKARIKNKSFWITVIPATLLFAQAIGSAFGVDLGLSDKGESVVGVINALFGVLACIGVINDPTVSNGALGFSDSAQAMTYESPKTDAQTFTTKQDLIDKLMKVVDGEIGYLGHASEDQLDDATANPGGLYTKYAKVLDNLPDGSHYFYGAKQNKAWCAVTVVYWFYTAFGLDKCRELLGHPIKNCYAAGVDWMYKYLKNNEVLVPEVGDIAIYGTWDEVNGVWKEEFSHVGIVREIGSDYVKITSGNAKGASPYAGGGVGSFKTYSDEHEITHYVRPNWR